MLGLKQLIDGHFIDNWIETPLWIDGNNFNNQTDKYIKIVQTPLSDDLLSIEGTYNRKEMLVEVASYAVTINEAMYLGDLVTKSLRTATDFHVRTNINNSAIQLDGKLYVNKTIATCYVNIADIAIFNLVDGAGFQLVDSDNNSLIG